MTPLIAFTGAVASAALLSPQGLVLDYEKGGGLVSIPYLFATLELLSVDVCCSWE